MNRVRVGSLGRAYRSPGSFGFTRGHSDTRNCLPVYSDSRGFTRERVEFGGINPFRVGSLGCAKCLPGFAFVHFGARKGRRVLSGSSGFTRARVLVTWFILLRVGSLRHV